MSCIQKNLYTACVKCWHVLERMSKAVSHFLWQKLLFFFFIWIIIKRLPLKRTHKAACFRHSAFYWFCTPNCTLISVSIIDISKSNCVGSHLLTALIARWWFKGVPQGSDLGPLYLKKKTFKDIENNRYKRQNPIQAYSMSNKGISALTLNGPTVTFFFLLFWNSNNLLFTNAET